MGCLGRPHLAGPSLLPGRSWHSKQPDHPERRRSLHQRLGLVAAALLWVLQDLSPGPLPRARQAAAAAAATEASFIPCPGAVQPPESKAQDAGARRRNLLLSLLGASAPLPAEAIFGIGESGPRLSTYTVAEAFNISFPPEWEVLTQNPEGLVVQGDRIQPLERMTAAVKRVSYTSLAEGWGTNITEVGERLAAKRPTGAAELLDAKADPNGDGLDMYQFEFTGDKLSELWIIALVKRGSDNFLCNVACRTPKLLYDSKRDTFSTVMKSFTPLPAATNTPVAPPESEPVTASS